MNTVGNTWCVILAAGDGKRMLTLARDDEGNPVPKQFWKYDGRRSLLEVALVRARGIADAQRIVPIVAASHRSWWGSQLAGVAPDNVVVQPENRGTAAGILLPLLHVARRDPKAHVVILPADHSIRDEDALQEAMRQALREIERRPREAVLLGIRPDAPDPEFGYIVPAPMAPSQLPAGSRPVIHFVEKPDPKAAAQLIGRGAFWNTFIMAATVHTWLDLFASCDPELVDAFARGLEGSPVRGTHRLQELYATLPVRDFSRQILWNSVDRLRVLPTRDCGWTDVGTPARYARWQEDSLPQALSA